jgi:hypothetical protein
MTNVKRLLIFYNFSVCTITVYINHNILYVLVGNPGRNKCNMVCQKVVE